MNYLKSLNFLYTQLPNFSKYGASAYFPGFDRILELLNGLNNPQDKLKFIHIAGTNGKGSVCHFLSSILQTKGYKVGLFTSPHLLDFRERIRVNGKYISKNYVVNFIKKLPVLHLKNQPSFFELVLALALDYFYAQKVDYVVLETGLGGRLDATNIVTPIISIITNIGLDHRELLGNTRALIAKEKAGIIKKNIPCVIGEIDAEIKSVFIAYKKKSPIYFADNIVKIKTTKQANHSLYCEIYDNFKSQKYYVKSGLYGPYQMNNIKTVWAAIRILNNLGINIPISIVKFSLKNIQKICPLLGRWQIINKKPLIIIDVAHNFEGFSFVLKQWKLHKYENEYLLIGVSKEKDYSSMLKNIPKKVKCFFTKSQSFRALDPEVLHNLARQRNLVSYSNTNIVDSLTQLKTLIKDKDRLIITGSIFFVGDVINVLNGNKF